MKDLQTNVKTGWIRPIRSMSAHIAWLNLTRRVLVPLSSEECLQVLQETVNDKFNDSFSFPMLGKYRLKIHSERRFDVSPRFFRRDPVIEGFVEKTEDDSCFIYIRLMPHLWFLLMFALFPFFFIGVLRTEKEWAIFLAGQ